MAHYVARNCAPRLRLRKGGGPRRLSGGEVGTVVVPPTVFLGLSGMQIVIEIEGWMNFFEFKVLLFREFLQDGAR